jgi:hypothetical protein
MIGKFPAWHNYNATYLERVFTTNELREEVEGVSIVLGGVVDVSSAPGVGAQVAGWVPQGI